MCNAGSHLSAKVDEDKGGAGGFACAFRFGPKAGETACLTLPHHATP